jgi:hypothetical protein
MLRFMAWLCLRDDSLSGSQMCIVVGRIEKEPEATCLHRRLFLDYIYGLGRIYTETEIAAAKQSPSFERE